MRVFCPSCQEPVTIADDLAGKATFCPLCKAAFTAPTLFSGQAPTPPMSAPGGYAVMPPPEVPAGKAAAEPPPREAAARMSDPAPAPGLQPSEGGFTRSCGYSITPEILQWVAPACLVLSVFLTFFSWNGAFPGGYGVYTQGPWRALFGSFSSDSVGEKVLKLDPDTAEHGATRLRDEVPGNYLFLIYLPLLLATAALAVLITIQPIIKLQIPPAVEPYLQWRLALVAGMSALLLLILTYKCLQGFGLENTLEMRARTSLKKMPERPNDEELKIREIEEGLAESRLAIRHTSALKLAYLLHVLAVVGAGGMFAIEKYRANKPWPRAEVLW